MSNSDKFADAWGLYSFFQVTLPFFTLVIFRSYWVQLLVFFVGLWALFSIPIINEGIKRAGVKYIRISWLFLLAYSLSFVLVLWVYKYFGFSPMLMIFLLIPALLLVSMPVMEQGRKASEASE